ncbi:MAG TPA: bifunctional adenosylcobinamide kinase/adenosylcobinamide-phosphate guanylyltransferase [Solirubrobacterales bacterium]|nr:bifunctional adenosylcobinamide kinase/adenosylcobinamide-phosphate guanylyltransferase [Solirubrobacterales bacterium]
MALTLLLGGARSGKSDLAVRIGRTWSQPVTFVATATAGDPDMAARIARHRAERPASWTCIEEPLDIAGALAECGDGGVIVDCLTVWVANLLDSGSPATTLAAAERVAAVARSREAPTLAVSNEVGLGVHPSSVRGREFRDVLGRVNAIWAAAAEEALFLVAGRALALDPVGPLEGMAGA